MKNMLLGALIVLSTNLGFAQETREDKKSVHPDLDVPEFDFSRFEKRREVVSNVLRSIEFDKTGKLEELSVSIPDYKKAHQNLFEATAATLNTYLANMNNLETMARHGAANLEMLRADYESKLAALKSAEHNYPGSSYSLEKSIRIEKERMQKDLNQKYDELVNEMRTEYGKLLHSVLASATDVEATKPQVADAVAYGTLTGVNFLTATILWAIPAPVPVMASPQFWFGIFSDDKVQQYGFLGVMGPIQEEVNNKYEHKRWAYNNALTSAVGLYSNCRTTVCVYELQKDYEVIMKQLVSLNHSVKVGHEKLNSNEKVSYRKIRKVLKHGADEAVKKLPTAEFVRSI